MNAGVLTHATAPATTDDEQLHWLALKLLPGLGTRRAVQLIERYRTPEAIFRASVSELEAEGLSPSVARSIASGCTFEDAVDQRQRMAESRTGLRRRMRHIQLAVTVVPQRCICDYAQPSSVDRIACFGVLSHSILFS